MIGRKCSFVLLVLGILVIIVGVVIIVVPSQLMPGLLKANLPLVETSKTFKPWSNPSKLPLTMEFRFFNIKNNLHTKATKESTDIPIELGGIPIVEEKGPYVYRERRIRSNITFNKDETELSFLEKTRFEFHRTASAGGEDDFIFGLNMPLMTVYDTLAKADLSGAPGLQPNTTIAMIDGMATQRQLEVIQKKTVSDWLWGSNSKILEALHEMKFLLPKEMQEKLPPVKFGYMDDNMATTHWVIGTGKEDLKDVAQIKEYNGHSELDFWGSCYSNRIKGTDGSIFHPGVDPKETLHMFSADICRTIYATNEGNEVIDGVKTLVFSLPSDVFADPKQNPKNEGFCEPKPCLGSGLLRVSNCRHDAPLVISQPHLCDAEEDRVNSIKGISCDPKLHKTRLYVEPNLGVLVKAHKRLEFNALIDPWKELDLTKKMKRGQIVPLFWVQEGFTADEEFAAMVKSNVNLMTFFPNNGNAIFYTLVTTGLILIIIAFFSVFYKPKTASDYQVPTVRMSSVVKREDGGYKNNAYRL